MGNLMDVSSVLAQKTPKYQAPFNCNNSSFRLDD